MAAAKKVSWPKWAKWVQEQLKDHQAKLKRLGEQLTTIENKLEPVHTAHLEIRVLELLRNEEKPRSWEWIRNRLGREAWDPLYILIRKGLVKTSLPGGRTMYVAAEA